MLIDLVPDFFAILDTADPQAAYQRYFDAHRQLLAPYWHNYVLDPDSEHFADVVHHTLSAKRHDLVRMLERTDVLSLARDTMSACEALLDVDVDIDVVLMVGVGAANAGELVNEGKGIAFVCLEHFTAVANEGTQGLGLDPELIPLWLAHEIAHVVRYTSLRSRSELRQLVMAAGGYYSYWDTARRASLRELLVNEGLAVEAARAVSPGHAEWEYFGYNRRQYAAIRDLETAITDDVAHQLDRAALGLRLRYLADGVPADARTMPGYVLPARSGYYVGSRMVERAVTARGLAWCIRADAHELLAGGAAAATA
jgi:hypothetical protein